MPAPGGSTTAVILVADFMVSERGIDGGAPVVKEGQLELALEAANLDPEEALEVGDQAMRDLDGLLALLGAES